MNHAITISAINHDNKQIVATRSRLEADPEGEDP